MMVKGSMLVLAAHPDDEVLGCGGTIARLAAHGRDVRIAILGEGITSRHDRREDADPSALRELVASSRKAAEILGAKEVRSYGLPDNRFDTLPILDLARIIEGLLDEFDPETVFVNHAGDLNVDHRRVHEAALVATRTTEDQKVRNLCAYEVPSSTEWAFHRIEPIFRPNVFVDVRHTLALKVEALACYESELRAFPHPRSTRAVESAAARWGSVAGLPAAEAFELIRSVVGCE